MVYIPIVPVIPQAPPSPEAQDLGQKIAELVRLMRQENPNIGPQDVRQGLSLAEQNLRPEIGCRSRTKILLVVALLVGIMVIGMFVAKRQGQGLDIPWMIIAIGALVVVLAGVAILRKCR
jgi:hypothetical protein